MKTSPLPDMPQEDGRRGGRHRAALALLVSVVLLATLAATLHGDSSRSSPVATRRDPCSEGRWSRGGGFSLLGRVQDDSGTASGGSHRFTAIADLAGPEAGRCPCSGIFADGFESGGMSAWSQSVGATAQ